MISAPRILLVGAGQLGSRHLQGLVKITADCRIDILDPSTAALALSRTRADEIKGAERHQLRFLEDASDLNDDYDLGINATTSRYRADSMKTTGPLAANWIIEKVLSQNLQQMETIEHAVEGADNTWVNLMMRELGWLQELYNALERETITGFETSGKDWSLACNAIHHIDLVAWLSRSQITRVITDQLHDEWKSSKRDGNFDLLGTLKVDYDNGLEATFSSLEDGPDRISQLTTNGKNWVIDEITAQVRCNDETVFSGVFDRQSDLTTTLAERVLSKLPLNLPRLEFAAATHRIFIAAMLNYWQKTMARNDQHVPIT